MRSALHVSPWSDPGRVSLQVEVPKEKVRAPVNHDSGLGWGSSYVRGGFNLTPQHGGEFCRWQAAGLCFPPSL